MTGKKKTEYQDIAFTDIGIHAVEPTKPAPWHRAINKSLRSGMPGRIYSKDFKMELIRKKDGSITARFSTPIPDDLNEKIKEIEKTGKKVRFLLPKKGLPIYSGKDMIEKINAVRKCPAKAHYK